MTQQSVTIPDTPSPEQAAAQRAHEQEMIQKAEGVHIQMADRDAEGRQVITSVQEPKADDGLILGKFKTTEELAAAYKELEKKLGERSSKPKPDDKPTDDKPADDQKPDEPKPDDKPADDKKPDESKSDESPKGTTPAKQTVIDKAIAEYAEKGELSPETFDALEKAGIPRAIVQDYVESAKARDAALQQSVYSVTGGEQGYAQMVTWAAANLSPAEIEAYNEAVTSGDHGKLMAAVNGLWARYQGANGFEPGDSLRGSGGTSNSGEMFRSRHEMQAAMSDPRYLKGDPAFHAEVQQKIANALKAGVQLFV